MAPELNSILHWRMIIIDKNDHPDLLPSDIPLPGKGVRLDRRPHAGGQVGLAITEKCKRHQEKKAERDQGTVKRRAALELLSLTRKVATEKKKKKKLVRDHH